MRLSPLSLFKLALWIQLVVGMIACTQTKRAPDVIPEPLKAEQIGKIEKLPADYPGHWIVQKSGGMMTQSEGRFIIIDPLAEKVQDQVKGAIAYAHMANFRWSKKRNEFYVGETVYSRGTRGEKTDLLTIWSTETLSPINEIILPGGKRAQLTAELYHPMLFNNDRFLLMLNFTPATSVNVIDLDKREKVNDIQIPGCVLIYPTGDSGFSSICSNGAMMTTILDDNGQTVSQNRTESFFNTDTKPYFTPAVISKNKTAFFASYYSNVMEVDLSGSIAVKGDEWSLLSAKDRKEGWRPGGSKIAAIDEQGLMYILMHPKGYNGSHKKGSQEVWVVDLEKRVRINRYKLKNTASSVFITRSTDPMDPLMITTSRQNVDVYRAKTGKFIRNLNDDIHMPAAGLVFN